MVPSLPPSNFSTDNICRFQYYIRVSLQLATSTNYWLNHFHLLLIQVTAITGLCHRDPVFYIPVFIGTYPILDELYSDEAVDNQQAINVAIDSYVPNAPSLQSTLSLNSTDLPPYPDTGSD